MSVRLFDLFYENDKDKIKIGASSFYSLICVYLLGSITKFYKDNHCHWVVDKNRQRNYYYQFYEFIIILLWKCQIQLF